MKKVLYSEKAQAIKNKNLEVFTIIFSLLNKGQQKKIFKSQAIQDFLKRNNIKVEGVD